MTQINSTRDNSEVQWKHPTLGSQPESGRPRERSPRTLRLEEEVANPSGRRPGASAWRRYVVMGVAAAAAVTIAVVGASFALSSGPQPGVVQLSTIPKDALVRFDNRPVTDSASPFVILNVKPKTKHSIEVSKPGYETRFIEGITIKSDQIKKLPPVVLRPSKSGFTLDSAPSNAKVFVDGTELGQQTPVTVTALTAGFHQVRVEQVGFLPWDSRIEVNAGAMVDLPIAQLVSMPVPSSAPKAQLQKELDPNAQAESVDSASEKKPRRPIVLLALGVLRIDSSPRSQVYVDGQLIGHTPQLNIKLEPGTHQVTLVNEQNSINKNITVDIPPGETVVRTYDLTAQ